MRKLTKLLFFFLLAFPVISWAVDITTWAELSAISTNETSLAQSYILKNDLNSSSTGYDDYASSSANEGAGWLPLGNSTNEFTGTFDGDNYTISDLYIDRATTDYVGLFGAVDTGATVSNLNLVDVDITGRQRTGGLSGSNIGTITSCTVTGGTVTGGGTYTGGFIGHSGGTITSCSSNVVVQNPSYASTGGFIGRVYMANISLCYAKGNVTGTSYLGGFIGEHERSTTTNSYAWGSVTGNTSGSTVGGFVGGTDHSSDNVDYCYSKGKPTNSGTGGVGAFCGVASVDTEITQCFYDSTTAETTVSDGGTAKTTAEMKTITTFSGASWDIVDNSAYVNEDWKIVPATTYPMLGWEEYISGLRKDSFFQFLLQ